MPLASDVATYTFPGGGKSLSPQAMWIPPPATRLPPPMGNSVGPTDGEGADDSAEEEEDGALPLPDEGSEAEKSGMHDDDDEAQGKGPTTLGADPAFTGDSEVRLL